jgi:AcrR family transcriptional regulator
MTTDTRTRRAILTAAKEALIESGYGSLSTRGIAERAGVPLSQIHYHFGSKKNLILEVLGEENRMLLERQARLYESDMPLWKQWEQACDFLDDDLESGYVRVLQEMTAAGWSDEEIADAVRENLSGWTVLLAETAERSGVDFGPFSAKEISALASLSFMGAETMILLGYSETAYPIRTALRKIGDVLRLLEK